MCARPDCPSAAAAAILAELATAAPRKWSRFDDAVADQEAPEVAHPRYDDPDMAAAYAYRDEVSSA